MRRAWRFARGERGQATIELLGAVPLVLLVSAAVIQALSAGVARELADHAAEAGAVALVQDADPRSAVRAALPGWARERVRVVVRGASVLVRLRPPALVPGLGGALDAHATATAGTAGS